MENLKKNLNLNDKIPIILEIGTMYTRMGFTGEDCPRRVMLTPKPIRRFLTTANRDVIINISSYF